MARRLFGTFSYAHCNNQLAKLIVSNEIISRSCYYVIDCSGRQLRPAGLPAGKPPVCDATPQVSHSISIQWFFSRPDTDTYKILKQLLYGNWIHANT